MYFSPKKKKKEKLTEESIIEESSKELSIENNHSFDLSFSLHIDHLKHSRPRLLRIPKRERTLKLMEKYSCASSLDL